MNVPKETDLIAKISHDMRLPLNGIIGFAELMYHGKVGPVSPDHKEYLGDILTSARHLLLLLNDVLDFSKVDAGQMRFHPELIDQNKILSEVRGIFHTLVTTKEIDLKIDVDPAIGDVVIDPVRFKQVIYNYVSNALKCTPKHGTVFVRLRPEGKENICLEVEDTGIGIRKEDFGRLFIEFEQIDANIARQYPSSGLGLALTKKIVEAQGGKVGLTSEVGKGSKFFAILPRQAVSKG